MTKIELLDGKYTVIHDNGRGLHALRHGGEWRNLAGDKLVLAMAYEIEDLADRIKYLREGLSYIAEDHSFDSPSDSAKVAEYYLEGRSD